MRFVLAFALLAASIAIAAPSKKASSKKFKDPRDGHTYKIVKIGKHNWLAENLTYKTRGSYCYNDDNENCHKYGRLYTWKAAMNACPTGWKLPDRKDWNFLSKYLGASKRTALESSKQARESALATTICGARTAKRPKPRSRFPVKATLTLLTKTWTSPHSSGLRLKKLPTSQTS